MESNGSTQQTIGANLPNPDLNGPQVAESISIQEKYDEERNKRLKPEGNNQYIDLRKSETHRQFIEDPWVLPGTPINTPVLEDQKVKIVIVGAGWGGILMAVKLLQAGFKHEDFLIVDPAGGFGGTWWWNRYPGLMCDIESYIYLPLLEETGYIPKQRYSFGHEIRAYAETVCSKYGLHQRGMFQSSVKDAVWDESGNDWVVKIIKKPKGEPESHHSIRADFMIFASGVLNNPKLADLPGIMEFQGHTFHTSRWDYNYTGGNPEEPELTGLEGKTVALVGTGATAIQSVPHLAKYAKELYVFQRTPSAVDVRGNRETDKSAWKKEVATGKGWWHDRNANFLRFVQNDPSPPSRDLVNDGWSKAPSFSALIGGPRYVGPEDMSAHVENLHAVDRPRQQRIRERVNDIVKDPNTAENLKAWYPTWCKRPCFHDEYLPTFNQSHVHLVDTDGKGINRVTKNGIIANGKEYGVDLIIWSTGFRSPFLGSPPGKSDVSVKGRNGTDIEELATAMELKTLHGVLARQFPNMFFIGAMQAAASANFAYLLDIMSTHVAYILATAVAKTSSPTTTSSSQQTNAPYASKRPVIEPTIEAQDAWALEIMTGSAALAGMAGCTPGYLNMEGAFSKMTPEQQMKAAAVGVWARGMPSFLEAIEGWRAQGGMEGLDVIAVA